MSCNYADGLSPYEHKGVLGIPEKFEPLHKLREKCEVLAQMIKESKHVVVHTGAGISTSAGIPDFRGPNGVWTLEKEGKKPTTDISFTDAKPTKTHMILKKLVKNNKVHYIVSQNIDGLHLKSGLQRKYLAELHGNMFIDECNLCKRQFVRSSPVETVGKKNSGVPCAAEHAGGRPCRGRLYDGVLDWEHSLPESDLIMAECHSSIADLSICLGTTLQIIPSGTLPLETAKYGGKLVICNLQPTKHDNKADLIINYYVDDILERVMNILGIEISPYNECEDPTKLAAAAIIDWTISKKDVKAIEKRFKAKCKGVKKIRNLIKNKRKGEDCKEVEQKIVKIVKKDKSVKIEKKDRAIKIKDKSNDSIKIKDDSNCPNNDTMIKMEEKPNGINVIIPNDVEKGTEGNPSSDKRETSVAQNGISKVESDVSKNDGNSYNGEYGHRESTINSSKVTKGIKTDVTESEDAKNVVTNNTIANGKTLMAV